MSQQRLDFRTVGATAYAAVSGTERYLQSCGLEKSLLDLVKMRASQINGCAYCLDMHSRTARQIGETEQRLYLLNAWRDSPLYSPRERAALAWTECLTHVATQGAPDDAYDALQAQFSAKEIVDLTVLIGQINLWNRLCIGLRAEHPVAKAA
jgi:AhpD family alkylhydroperoxidase